MLFLRLLLALFLFSFPLLAINPPLSPEELLTEKKKFAYQPWFTGPILSGSGTCLPPRYWDIQPYFSFGSFNQSFTARGKTTTGSRKKLIDFLTVVEAGIVSGLDMNVILEEFYVRVNHQSAHIFGDTLVTLGIQAHKEDEEWPAIRVVFQETFPTGKYEHLNPLMESMDGYVGSGCFTSHIGLALSKIIYWFYRHPIAWRLNLLQEFPTNAHVHGFNSYGGGFGTNGTVAPPKTFTALFSFEFSFNQRWVYAMDIQYKRFTRNRFHGFSGTDAKGTPAINAQPFFQSYVLTPSIEYNIKANQGLIFGGFITIYGHNAFKIVNTVVSYEIIF